jgi:hypothetical protein
MTWSSREDEHKSPKDTETDKSICDWRSGPFSSIVAISCEVVRCNSTGASGSVSGAVNSNNLLS